jgi:dienelactone hydrolase
MLRKAVLTLLAFAGIACMQAAPAVASAMVEEETLLQVQIGARTYQLEALIIRRADAKGRLPIALITHGKNFAAEENARKTARDMIGQMHDFAHRGWLAVSVLRRGFGRSEGPQTRSGGCDHQNFRDYFTYNADDLVAALEVVARRPDADSTRVLAVGVSAGGGSVVALAARRPAGLVGVVNVSGGLHLRRRNAEPCEFGESLAAAFGFFGRQSSAPTLWLYAENDKLFDVDLVRRMHTAYVTNGGVADLKVFPPITDDGHRLWNRFDGRRQWLPVLDAFLVANKLPTWDRAALEAKLKVVLGPDPLRPAVESYLAAPGPKALAVSRTSRKVAWWGGGTDLETVRQKSVAECEQRHSEPCVVIVENFDLVPEGAQGGNQ